MDNYSRWSQYDDEQTQAQAEWEASLPTCVYCEKPIEDDWCYEIKDECYCEECMKKQHRKWLV